jgi:endonuclease G
MAQLDRIRQAVLEIRSEAVKRWQLRISERDRNHQALVAGGEGAADSPHRVACFRTRRAMQYAFATGRNPSVRPIGLERMMGPTWDSFTMPPNEVARKAGRPVARIVEYSGPGVQPIGQATGFLVDSNLLMTNHHVFATARETIGYAVNFGFERSQRGIETGVVFELDPDTFFLSDQSLDFAITAVKVRSVDGGSILAEYAPIRLIEATPKILRGQPVNIIQHPEGRPKEYAYQQNKLIDILEKDGFLHYETDTQRGSSGSPAFNEVWELIALHHTAIPEVKDGKVTTTTGKAWNPETPDDEVKWVANEGTRVSAMVGKLASTTLADPRKQEILRRLLDSTVDPVTADPAVESTGHRAAKIANPIRFPSNHGDSSVSQNNFHFSGPVTINILPQAAPTVAPDVSRGIEGPKAEERAIRFDPDYSNRKGYIPSFLGTGGLRVPVPIVSDERSSEIVAKANGSPLVLKYHHFELVMNRHRRLMMWSAVNVDYSPERKSKRSREDFGRDKWIADSRLAAELQIADAELYAPAKNIDRGHIVRREDNAWGDTELEIEYANSDTFHWTNCTPQHEAFNQADPGRDPIYRGLKGLWGDFENYIQQSRKGKDTKACILAGPVLAHDDPKADFGQGELQYPVDFWKVVCIADPDQPGGAPKLKVYGFILSQKKIVEEYKLGLEKFTPGRFKDYRKKLESISQVTGVEFHQTLLDADTM